MAVRGAKRAKAAATHTMPSGMGGVFPVVVKGEADGKTIVSIHMPGTEWHGWMGDLKVDPAELKEIPAET